MNFSVHDGTSNGSKSFPTTPHTLKFEFKRRSYVINKLEKKTSPLVVFVMTKPGTKLILCRDRVLATNSAAKKPNFVATELATNSVMTKSDFVTTELKTKS